MPLDSACDGNIKDHVTALWICDKEKQRNLFSGDDIAALYHKCCFV